ncbi:hypothetical protein HALLA_10575 [Halostagnicola larsenii XH-48]|uniref:Uncharacterized protein n=1 Tax=Halostagnicola larsenii XH-48 TaxID=797299 RepID=W0JQ80_9EURY|nr:hypothetical protein [Halostagnicola larsenii]AHG00876.1 hypothetical protein HALLA_10575 [Halostagnicola larsenii XH-48]
MVSNRMLVSLGVVVLVLVAGIGVVTSFHPLSDEPAEQVHIESYPAGPEKPTSVDSSNVADYTATYEERLFYNDLLASHDHSFESDESVIAECTPLSVSNASTDGFDVQLECRGGVTDSAELSASEESTYAVDYRVTNTATRQTAFQDYPFETDRTFNNERENE